MILEISRLYIGSTKSGDDICLVSNQILTKDKEGFEEYTRYYFYIKNISDQIMGVFVLDRNIANDGDKYFDVGWIEIYEKFRKQGIASSVYRHINQELIKQTGYHLYSDRTKLSPEAKGLRNYLYENGDAELVGKFPTGKDNKEIPIYHMK